ncbi:methyltransferase domain-containing protein [Modestobacter sp. I12A-02628]|uniref:Class I SAM-dependent methyltransferase n=1 Tax=Goekera deserti TaxID=2497753 RepID=A0A7K3WB48_9ACTN|nr:class I SAM-dependent methyltransferase [Goekera deserti]MPQ98913.1 methyltransferase domain-containing protein [Goekera deserti]NDI49588.1 methyltransferase domain-containing protein [Goekera deserti]NEL53219.1 class I SAM-dependent methyltransferase [Goekera deserti]
MDDGAGRSWDPTLYAGSAAYYATGRVGYPAELAGALAGALGWDGTGRLLDVGCGPGSLTLLLAPWFAETVGLDADADMLREAERAAAAAGVRAVRWRQLRAEELPADLPPVDVVTFAQSFHWLDRPRVAATVRDMLTPGGVVVHVGATTHEGIDPDGPLPWPRPPRAEIAQLVRRRLGPARRAGQGVVTGTPGDEDAVYRAAGFTGPQRLEVPGRVVERSLDEVAASVHSLSSSAPHLFGDRFAEHDAELRALLARASPSGRFSEQMRSISLRVWRPV